MTHECDYPADVLNLPKVTRDVIGPGLAPDEIDRAVRALTEQGRSIYELDETQLRRLQPDLIVTQALCSVCAVSVDDVRAIAERMDPVPRDRLARPAHDRRGARRRPHARPGHRREGRRRRRSSRTPPRGSTACGSPTRGAARKVRVALLEWLDPVYRRRALGAAADRLRRRRGSARARRRAVRAALVGGGRGRPAAGRRRRAVRLRRRSAATRRRSPTRDELAALGAERIVVADAAAWFSRPGPRLVDGLEWLAHVLHPDRVPEPPGGVREVVLN